MSLEITELWKQISEKNSGRLQGYSVKNIELIYLNDGFLTYDSFIKVLETKEIWVPTKEHLHFGNFVDYFMSSTKKLQRI